MENFFYKCTHAEIPIDAHNSKPDSPVMVKSALQPDPSQPASDPKPENADSRKVRLVNFVLSELLSDCKISEKDILDFKTKEVVFNRDSSEVVIVIRCRSTLGDLEVRFTRPKTAHLDRYEQEKKAQLNSVRLLYESVERNYLQKSPSFSHSRVMAFQRDLDSAKLTDDQLQKVVLEVEEDLGDEFAHVIMHQIHEYITSPLHSPAHEEFNIDLLKPTSLKSIQDLSKSVELTKKSEHVSKKQKGSLIAFLWGSILASFCKKLQKTSTKLAVKTGLYSHLTMEFEQGKPVYVEKAFKLQEQTHYTAILQRIKAKFEKDFSKPLLILGVKLAPVFKNEVYSLFREEEVMVYSPKFLDAEHLRIFRKKSDLKMEPKNEGILGVSYNPYAGMTRKNVDVLTSLKDANFDFGVQAAESGIFGRYRIFAQLEFLLQHQLDQIVRENGSFLKGYECDIAESMLQGFKVNYQVFKEDGIILSYPPLTQQALRRVRNAPQEKARRGLQARCRPRLGQKSRRQLLDEQGVPGDSPPRHHPNREALLLPRPH